MVVVSGLAYGIDAAAHEGALEARGRTVAVLASGLDRPSPVGNRRLAERILEAGGAWLSEYPPGEEAQAYRFPERNRLISGLSSWTLIVEARRKSGSLWTARHAVEQNREVLAVPGPVDTEQCRGSNELIRSGATPILDAEQLLELVSPGRPVSPRSLFEPPATGSGESARVLQRLADGASHPDALARELGLSPQALASLLLDLELEGKVVRMGTRVALRTPPAGDRLRYPG
jgi:DNA processing protein